MGNICSICRKPSDSLLLHAVEGQGKIYDIFLCDKDKVGFTVQAPSTEDLSRLYSSGSYRSEDGWRFIWPIEFIIYRFRLQRKKRIEKFIKNGHLLDVGCGRGLFLDIMKQAGWDVKGVEFSQETVDHISRKYNIPVVSGEPRQWAFSGESFDVVTLSHVLEHLPDPLSMIDECLRLLKKGGMLVCAVPNISSLQASVGRENWFHLDIPYHIHHFSEEGLRGLLERKGFKIMRTRRFDIEHNPFGWLQTLMNMSTIRKNLLYDLLKKPELRRDELAGAKKKDILLTLILLPFYLPLSLLLSVVETFVLKKAGTVEVYAVKR